MFKERFIIFNNEKPSGSLAENIDVEKEFKRMETELTDLLQKEGYTIMLALFAEEVFSMGSTLKSEQAKILEYGKTKIKEGNKFVGVENNLMIIVWINKDGEKYKEINPMFKNATIKKNLTSVSLKKLASLETNLTKDKHDKAKAKEELKEKYLASSIKEGETSSQKKLTKSQNLFKKLKKESGKMDPEYLTDANIKKLLKYNGDITLAMDILLDKNTELRILSVPSFSFSSLNPSEFCDEIENYLGDIYDKEGEIPKTKLQRKVQKKINQYYIKLSKAKSKTKFKDKLALKSCLTLLEARLTTIAITNGFKINIKNQA